MSGDGAGDNARQLAAATVETLLQSGAALARGFAQAVSGKQPPVVPGEAPLAAMVRHTSAGVAGILKVAVEAARSAGAGSPAGAVEPVPSSGPIVGAGETLRIPLSVDNPGAEPMTGLTPAVLSATCNGLPARAHPVEFTPATLAIAPFDFEKLVLTVKVPRKAAEGLWRLRFRIGPDEAAAATEIVYRVVRAQA